MSPENLAEIIESRIREAKRTAERFGTAVGHVELLEEAVVGEEGHKIVVRIPPDTYLTMGVRMGEYLGIATLMGTVMLAKVISVKRAHVAGMLNIQVPMAHVEDYAGLATPAAVELEPLTECRVEEFETCDPAPVHTPVDPYSVVFKPRAEFLAKMLGLPSEGVPVGALYAGGEALGVDIRLPPQLFYQHMLVVGTTGSGKTVFLKNLALALLNEVPGATAVALDLQGDYLQMVLPPEGAGGKYGHVHEITVILPITSWLLDEWREALRKYARERLGEEHDIIDVEDPEELADVVGYGIARKFVEETYPDGELINADVKFAEAGEGKIERKESDEKAGAKEAGKSANAAAQGVEASARLLGVECNVAVGDAIFRLKLLPWALNFNETYRDIPNILPVFSEQVALLFGKIVNELRKGVQEGGGQTVLQALMQKLSTMEGKTRIGDVTLHSSQVGNLLRGFAMLAEMGIFDVKYSNEYKGRSSRKETPVVRFDEPNYAELRGLVAVDLRWLAEKPAVASAVVYRILSKIYAAQDEELKKGTARPIFVLIDEAHNYFPQTARREELNKQVVEGLINKITRLGRVRKIGVIFATHTPADLNDLIIQLTNTKVAFRSERQVLEKIGMADAAAELEYAQNGVAVLKSYAIRTHTLVVRSYPPMTRHRSHEQ